MGDSFDYTRVLAGSDASTKRPATTTHPTRRSLCHSFAFPVPISAVQAFSFAALTDNS